MDYLGSECPVCREKLARGQDIVVCPECGAPYHRKCYAQSGHCVFEDKHKDGFEYTLPKREKLVFPSSPGDAGPAAQPSAQEQEADRGILCPKCGTINEGGNIFCENCGTPLHSNSNRNNRQSAAGGGPAPFTETLGGEIDGVAKKDLHEFIGPSADIYLLRMTQQQVNATRATFMASPFLLAPFYFAYRKMWGWAALAGSLWLLFSVPTFLVMLLEGGASDTAAAMPVVLEYLRFAADAVNLVVRFLFGFFALNLYRKQSVKKIKQLQTAPLDGADYHDSLQKSGGVSYIGVALVIAAFFLVAFVLSFFFGNTIINYVLNVF